MCSPTAGGGRPVQRPLAVERERAARRAVRSGIVGMASGCSIPSASVCGARATSATSATGAAGTPASVSRCLPVRRVVAREPLVEDRTELVPVRDTIGVGPEARIVDELGQAEHAADRSEDPVVAAGDHQLAVAGRGTPGTAPPSGTGCPGRAGRCRRRGSRRGDSRCSRARSRRARRRPPRPRRSGRARAARRARRARPTCPFPDRSATSRPERPAGRAPRSSRSTRPRPASARRSPARGGAGPTWP